MLKRLKEKIRQQVSWEYVVGEAVETLCISRDEAERRVQNLLKSGINCGDPESELYQRNIDAYMQIPSRLAGIYPLLVSKEANKKVYDENDPYDCFLIMKRSLAEAPYELMKMVVMVNKLGGRGAAKWLLEGKAYPKGENIDTYKQIYSNALLHIEKLIHD